MEKPIKALDNYIRLLRLSRRGVIWLNVEGRILYANQKLVDDLRYDLHSIKEKTVFDINPNMSLRKWKTFWQQLQKAGTSHEVSEYITQDGIIFEVDLNSTALEADGEQYCCIISQRLGDKDQYKNLLGLTSDVARIGFWDWDILNEKVYLSEFFYDFFHLNREKPINKIEEVSKLLGQLLKPKAFEALSNHFEQAVRNATAFEQEQIIEDKGGTKRNLYIKAVPVSVDERTTRIYGVLQDISSIAVRSDELFLAKFSLESARDLIFWVNKDAELVFANESACSHLEYEREELLKCKVFDIDPQFQPEDWATFFEQVKEEGALEIDSIHRKKSGEKYPIFATLNYLVYDGKEYICAIIRNVTKLKEQQRRLESFKFALDNAIEAIFWINKKGKFKYVNQSTSKKLGYSTEELLSLSIFDINPDMAVSKWQAEWKNLSENKEQRFETTYITKDGRMLPVLVYTNHMVLDNEELNVSFVRDITLMKERQRKLEASLEENEKLRQKLESEKNYLQEEISINYNFANIISTSERYKIVLKQVEQVADTDATVLLLGETGTGKELLARAIHSLSERSDQSLVKVNCSALPVNLIESELFGHEKGAFTGAFQRKIGRFELADGGTIFLDEIGEMPIELQAKLLRVLQEGEFQRLGNPATIKVDVRVIAATNRNLENLVDEGRFRQDLYYRLNVFPIYNIPLRERVEDIPLLVKHFLKKFSERVGKPIKKISKGSLEKLMRYSFPGNIRELENIIERAVILSTGSSLDIDAVLPSGNKKLARRNRFKTFDEMQKEHILEALRKTNWKVTGKMSAAELLGLNGKTLASKLRKLDIRREDYLDI